jgi:hypothetical protein
VVADLSHLQTTLVNGLDAANGWQQGTTSAATARADLARDLPSLVRAHDAVARLHPLPGHTRARNDYAAALALYVAAFRLEQAATAMPPGVLRAQLQRGFVRIRELGDVTFDQGTAELAPLLGASVAGIDVAAAAHVPDWQALGLAPGPPLASGWTGTTAEPTGTQSAAAWSAAVLAAGAPPQSAIAADLVRKKNAATLNRDAAALGRAEVSLSSVPGPADDAQASALVRIGLLVDAEAVLAAEAGRRSPHGASAALDSVGRSLGSLGGDLRDAG